MINPEMRLQLPLLPGKDDVFVKMGLLFIEAYEEISRLEGLLDPTKTHISDYLEARRKYLEDLPVRYLEVVKEYQELLFVQPVTEEQAMIDEDISPEANIIMQSVDPAVRNAYEEEMVNPSLRRALGDDGPAMMV